MSRKSDSTTNRDRYGPGIAMTDLATNLLGVFICLFMLAFLMASKKIEEVNQNKVESKVEFILTVTWDKETDIDIDTYVEDPLNNIVFYRSKEKGLMHLDRDDIGYSNDGLITQDGTQIKVRDNREIVAFRGIIPGEYSVNAHMYANRQNSPNITVTMRLDKINPKFSTIIQRDVVLEKVGEEKTAFRFTLDEKGDVVSTNDLYKNMAHHREYKQSYGPESGSPEYSGEGEGP